MPLDGMSLLGGGAAWFGQLGLMAWPLAACSVVTVAVAAERMVFSVRARLRREEAYKQMAADLKAHDSLPKPLRDEVAAVMLEARRRPFLAGVRCLRMVGTVSPLLGLLGTILGIIAAFQAIAKQTGPVSPGLIADGLWEAMLTTAVGLSIALPALVLAHVFKHLGDRELEVLRHRLNRLSLSIEIERVGRPGQETASVVQRLSA